MKKISYLLCLCVAVFAGSLRPAMAGNVVDVTSSKSADTITLYVPHAGKYKVFTLSNPDRLVIDLPALNNVPVVALPSGYKGDFIKDIRFARFDPQTSRFVFDLTKSVKVQQVDDGSGANITVKIVAGKQSGGVITREFKKKEKPVVVIDAGHGGQDPGTTGPKGTQEKKIVLEYAKSLKAKLDKTGRYKVLLTRDDDRYIMLRERVDIARKAKGAIFISLHADSAPDKGTRGLSVYTVSEKASDQEAEALAARENKSDVIAGMDLSEEREDVAGILISLAQRETKNNAATLADLLVLKLDEQVKLLQNTHRFAGFAVLKAPDIPSVLIEIGFLSNPAEEKLLLSKSYKEKVTAGIVSGIDAYFNQYPYNGSD